MGINDVQCTCYRAQHHTNDLQRVEKVWPEPAIIRHVVCRDPKSIQSCTSKYQLRHHEHNTKLRFIDSFVFPNHNLCAPVGQQTRQKEAQYCSNKWPCVHIAGVYFVKPKRRAKEYCLCFSLVSISSLM